MLFSFCLFNRFAASVIIELPGLKNSVRIQDEKVVFSPTSFGGKSCFFTQNLQEIIFKSSHFAKTAPFILIFFTPFILFRYVVFFVVFFLFFLLLCFPSGSFYGLPKFNTEFSSLVYRYEVKKCLNHGLDHPCR